MTGKVEGAVSDAKIAGTFVKNTGSTALLSFCIVILTVSLVVSVVTAKVGTDRYTGTDHKNYEEKSLLERTKLWENQEEVNKELEAKIEALEDNSFEIRENVAVTKTKVTGIESDIAEIKELLMRRVDQ